MSSSPSSRQFDLNTTTREKISHDQWQHELSQTNSSEAEDGDLGLRGLSEDVMNLELANSSSSLLSPLTTTETTSKLDSPPRIPPRLGTPVPNDTLNEVNNLTA